MAPRSILKGVVALLLVLLSTQGLLAGERGAFIEAPGKSPYRVVPPGWPEPQLLGRSGDVVLMSISSEELRLAEAVYFSRRRGGDGAGADVGSLEVYQIRYLDSKCSFPTQCGGPCNVVVLAWQEETLNPSGVRVLMNGAELGTLPGLTEVPGINAVNIISVPAAAITFRVEDISGGTFDEASILVVNAQPFEDPQDLACSPGNAEEGGTCGLVVSWKNGDSVPERYEAYFDDQYVVSVLGAEDLLLLSGAPPGTHTVGLVGVTQEGPKSYYIGCFVETTCDVNCTDGPCDPPRALRLCQAAYGQGEVNAVRAEWLNGENPYAVGIKGYADGNLVGTIATDPEDGTPSIARFGSLTPGEHKIGIQGDCGSDVVSETTEATFAALEASPHTTPIEGTVECTFDSAVPSTTAVWTNATPSLFIDVYVESESQLFPVGTIPGDSTTVTLTGTAEGDSIALQFFTTVGGGCYGSELVSCGAGEMSFHRGDVDQNNTVELTDAIQILSHLFLGESTRVPECEDAADGDDNGTVELTDAIRILGHLFLGTGPLPAPGAAEDPCGPDPTTEGDSLGCVSYDPANCATP